MYFLLGDNIIATHQINSKDLGMVNLQRSDHYNNILSRAYQMLGLNHHTFCANASTLSKTKYLLYSYSN